VTYCNHTGVQRLNFVRCVELVGRLKLPHFPLHLSSGYSGYHTHPILTVIVLLRHAIENDSQATLLITMSTHPFTMRPCYDHQCDQPTLLQWVHPSFRPSVSEVTKRGNACPLAFTHAITVICLSFSTSSFELSSGLSQVLSLVSSGPKAYPTCLQYIYQCWLNKSPAEFPYISKCWFLFSSLRQFVQRFTVALPL